MAGNNFLKKIPIEAIIIPKNRREIDWQTVFSISESMKKIGMLNPITVRKVNDELVLVAGAHRIEAKKLLNEKEILTRVLELDDNEAILAELDENLYRSELHFIERADVLVKRQEIYEKLYPQAKQYSSEKQRMKATGQIDETITPAFSEATAKLMDCSIRTVQQDLQMGKNLSPESKVFLKERDFSRTDAIKLSKLPVELQEEIIIKISDGYCKNMEEVIASVKPKPTTEPDVIESEDNYGEVIEDEEEYEFFNGEYDFEEDEDVLEPSVDREADNTTAPREQEVHTSKDGKPKLNKAKEVHVTFDNELYQKMRKHVKSENIKLEEFIVKAVETILSEYNIEE